MLVHESAMLQRAERPSYAEQDNWRRYQRFLTPRMRITEGREPAEEWWAWRGAAIHLDRYESPAAPLTVVMLHGAGGCGRLLAPFGSLLHAHGYEIVLPDLPGYGLSDVPTELFTYDRWVDCIVDLVNAESERSGRPVVLFGTSLGGYLAYLAAAKGRQAAGVIATTLGDPRLRIVRKQFSKNPRLSRVLTPLLTPVAAALLGGLRLPIRWFAKMERISNNPELARLLCADPIAGGNRVPLGFLYSLLRIKPALDPADFDVCPVLLAHPGADRWITLDASRPVFDRIKGPKQLVTLANCGHLPIEEPGVSQLEEAVVAFLESLPHGDCG